MDLVQAYVISTVNRLEAEEARLREMIGISGALPGEVGIITRLSRLPGHSYVDSMRTDLK